MKITLSQTASWNDQLVNGYRTRYTTAAGRYFEVKAESLNSVWFVNEITAAGDWIPDGYGAIAFTLAEARTLIAAEARLAVPAEYLVPARQD